MSMWRKTGIRCKSFVIHLLRVSKPPLNILAHTCFLFPHLSFISWFIFLFLTFIPTSLLKDSVPNTFTLLLSLKSLTHNSESCYTVEDKDSSSIITRTDSWFFTGNSLVSLPPSSPLPYVAYFHIILPYGSNGWFQVLELFPFLEFHHTLWVISLPLYRARTSVAQTTIASIICSQ